MCSEVDSFIQTSGIFITDLDDIITTFLQTQEISLYDTVAISVHENVFHHHNINYLKHFINDTHPIVFTDTIIREMLKGDEQRYIRYLSQFRKLIFLKEQDFPKLFEDFYSTQQLKVKFLLASEKAFSDIQPIKHAINEIRTHRFQTAESSILDVVNSFFYEQNQKNRGELSMLWLSCVLEIIAPNLNIKFIGIDNDLYTYVHRCYLKSPYDYSKKLREIRILSNDSLLQAINSMNISLPGPKLDFEGYLDLYRDPNRNVIYFEKSNGIMDLTVKREKLNNGTFKDLILNNAIEIVY